MALKIRLARGGSKKRPYYSVVVADVRAPRDGRFVEKLGAYNPLLAKDDEKRFHVDVERTKHWLSVGAQPTDRVARYLSNVGLVDWKAGNNPNKAKPGKKAMERIEEQKAKEEAAKEAEEAAKAEAEAAAAEPAAEEAPAEAPAEEAAEEKAE
jgi:small subunit ribosomal protein S16